MKNIGEYEESDERSDKRVVPMMTKMPWFAAHWTACLSRSYWNISRHNAHIVQHHASSNHAGEVTYLIRLDVRLACTDVERPIPNRDSYMIQPSRGDSSEVRFGDECVPMVLERCERN